MLKSILLYFSLFLVLLSCSSTNKENLPEGKRVVMIGAIDPNDIFKALVENVKSFEECYNKNIITNGMPKDAMLALQFVIGPSGNVTKANATNKDNNLPARTKDCIVSHLKTLHFPKPNGGAEVIVNTPLKIQAKQR